MLTPYLIETDHFHRSRKNTDELLSKFNSGREEGSDYFLNDIIQQVIRAQSQTEQLDRLDQLEIDCLSKSSASLLDDEHFIVINNDVVIPKSRDNDTSKIEVLDSDCEFDWVALMSGQPSS